MKVLLQDQANINSPVVYHFVFGCDVFDDETLMLRQQLPLFVKLRRLKGRFLVVTDALKNRRKGFEKH